MWLLLVFSDHAWFGPLAQSISQTPVVQNGTCPSQLDADLSASGRERLKAVCATQCIEWMAELPFDSGITSSLGKVAEGVVMRPRFSDLLPTIREALADLAEGVKEWMA